MKKLKFLKKFVLVKCFQFEAFEAFHSEKKSNFIDFKRLIFIESQLDQKTEWFRRKEARISMLEILQALNPSSR